jgi:hypothetical protein
MKGVKTMPNQNPQQTVQQCMDQCNQMLTQLRGAQGQVTAQEAQVAMNLVINEMEHCVQQCNTALQHFTCCATEAGATV